MTYRQIPISKNYEASIEGVVRRIGGNPLKGYVNKHRNNYVQVVLSEDGKTKTWKVHQLIALTFPEICGERFEGSEVEHINCIPTDNRAENLRWVTKEDNMNNPITRENCKNAYTEEHREICRKRMIESNPAKQEGFWTEERRNAISERMKGRKHTPEAIEKMRKATKGRYLGGKSAKAKSVKCIAPDGTETIYDAFNSAQRATGISHSTIRSCINGNKSDKQGNLWQLC